MRNANIKSNYRRNSDNNLMDEDITSCFENEENDFDEVKSEVNFNFDIRQAIMMNRFGR